MSEWEKAFLTGEGAHWKGLDKVLEEISRRTPGISLEHTDLAEGAREPWMGPEKKIHSVERWLAIIRKDLQRAPNAQARQMILGPNYFWDTDDLGRAVVAANHFGRAVVMFIEVWAGEPDA